MNSKLPESAGSVNDRQFLRVVHRHLLHQKAPLTRRRQRDRGLPWVSLAGPGVVQLLALAQQLGVPRMQCWKPVRRLAIFRARGVSYYLAAWKQAKAELAKLLHLTAQLKAQQHADRDAWQAANMMPAQKLITLAVPIPVGQPMRRTLIQAALVCAMGQSVGGDPAHSSKPQLLYTDHFADFPSDAETVFAGREDYDQMCESASTLLGHVARLEKPAADQAALGEQLSEEIACYQAGMPRGVYDYATYLRAVELLRVAIWRGTNRETISAVMSPQVIHPGDLTMAWAVAAAQAGREALLNHNVADLSDAVGHGRHPRSRGCGTVRVSQHGEKFVGVCTMCKLKRSCAYCRAWFQVIQFRHLAKILLDLPVVHIVEAALDDAGAIATRIRRTADQFGRAGRYRRVQQPGGRVVIFSSVSVAGSVAHTPEAAVRRLRVAIELIPRNVAKPICGSHEWSIPKVKKQGGVDLGTGWGDSLQLLEQFWREAGLVSVGAHTTGGMPAIHATMPQQYQRCTDAVASHLHEWFSFWREFDGLPPTFDLSQPSPTLSFTLSP